MKMCTFERKIGKTGILKNNFAQLDKILKILTYFMAFKSIPLRKIFSQKICLQKKNYVKKV